jgi:Protein of unknown function (DUF1091)
MSYVYEAKQTIFETEERLKLFRAEDEHDSNLNHFMFGGSMNFCKFSVAVKKNLIIRIIAEGYSKNENSTTICPILRGTRRTVNDVMIKDDFIPPLPTEMRFRVEANVFAKLEKQKSFKRTYRWDLYLSVKK